MEESQKPELNLVSSKADRDPEELSNRTEMKHNEQQHSSLLDKPLKREKRSWFCCCKSDIDLENLSETEIDEAEKMLDMRQPLRNIPIWKTLPYLKPIKKCLCNCLLWEKKNHVAEENSSSQITEPIEEKVISPFEDSEQLLK